MNPVPGAPANMPGPPTQSRDRKTRVLLGLGIAGFVFGAAFHFAGPAAKTRFYFAMEREWQRHFPQKTDAESRLGRLLEPFVPIWVRVEPGMEMLLDPNDLVSEMILKTGAWEPASWGAVEKHLRPGATFIDVGAHIGYYSLKAAVRVGPTGRVLAIEPNPETLRKLRDNIAASHAGIIRVEPVACSDSEAMLDLFAGPATNSGETSLSRVNATQDGASTVTYRVRARPLDAIIREAELSRVDEVKIDVEGAELLVLKGAKDTLDRFHPVVLAEVYDPQLRQMGGSAAEVIAFMRAHGYDSGRWFDGNLEFDPAGGR